MEQHVTPCNAVERHETPRVDKIREDLKPPSSNSLALAKRARALQEPQEGGYFFPESSEEDAHTPGRAAAPDDPGMEFQELREFYDRNVRTDGPLSGLVEFKQAKAARVWPGMARFCQAVTDLVERDHEWVKGKRPGLKRFIAERMWDMRPRAAPDGNAPPLPPPKSPEQLARERAAGEKALEAMRKSSRAETARIIGQERKA